MDFIERFFGVGPDGGDGSAELMIVAAIVIVLAGVAAARMPRLREGAVRAKAFITGDRLLGFN